MPPRIRALVLAWLVWPAATAGIVLGLTGSKADGTWGPILLAACPGLLMGLLVGRKWLLGVPPVGWGAALLVAYGLDPGCQSCGDDSWVGIVYIVALVLVFPSLVAVLLGITARWAAQRLHEGRP